MDDDYIVEDRRGNEIGRIRRDTGSSSGSGPPASAETIGQAFVTSAIVWFFSSFLFMFVFDGDPTSQHAAVALVTGGLFSAIVAGGGLYRVALVSLGLTGLVAAAYELGGTKVVAQRSASPPPIAAAKTSMPVAETGAAGTADSEATPPEQLDIPQPGDERDAYCLNVISSLKSQMEAEWQDGLTAAQRDACRAFVE